MVGFIITFLTTNILFSLVLGLALSRLNRFKLYANKELFLYALGLGPMFTALLLYYLMLLIPIQSHLFYIISVFLAFLGIFAFSCKQIRTAVKSIKSSLQSTFISWKNKNLQTKIKASLYTALVLLFAIGYVTIFLGNTFHNPIEGHDALIYGNLGKEYFQERQVNYVKIM